MPDQLKREIVNLESCKRLQALANYREEENELFEALSVLNDALFYLQPKGFLEASEQYIEANKLKVEIWIKQVELCLGLQKPRRAIPSMIECNCPLMQ